MANQDAMAGIESMLSGMGGGGAAGGMAVGGPPAGATQGSSGEEPDVVAMLAMENAQLRALVGLGPEDPIPAPAAPGGAGGLPGAGAPPPAF